MEIETLKSVKQPKSIEIVAAIDDLLTEILFRLPTEHLMRCQLVSKHWQSLISNPNFRRRRNLDPVPAAGLFFPGNSFRINRLYEYIPFSPKAAIAPFSRLDFTDEPSGIRIIQSCNGVLFCRSSNPSPSTGPNYYLYNPSTHQFSTLPRPKWTTIIRGMSLAFDPTRSSHYKVVCVSGIDGLVDCPSQIMIYSSKTCAWKKINERLSSKHYYGDGVYWNNAIHWIKRWHPYGDSLYFNIHSHVLEKMPTPPARDAKISLHYIWQSCDHLHYAELYHEQTQFIVYEMKRDYSEWFVKYNVDLSPVAAANQEMLTDVFGRTVFSFYVCSLVRDEEQEDGSFLVVEIPGKVIRYNLIAKTFEKLHELENTGEVQAANKFPRIGSESCV